VELLALVRTKRPRVQHAVLPRDRDLSRWFMRAAASIERAILAGHFPPAPGATCASCEYRGVCLGIEAEAADAEAA
jgi:CRISPR/Cas system-associated exonuclease Cas4 (RecB family)